MIDQVRAIDNKRLLKKLGNLPGHLKDKVKDNLKIVMDLWRNRQWCFPAKTCLLSMGLHDVDVDSESFVDVHGANGAGGAGDEVAGSGEIF